MHSLGHMLWGVTKHVAFGYLIYSLVQHYQGRAPTGQTTSVVLLGAIFPDVVDKPFVVLGVLEYGRAAAHSLLTATVIIAGVRWLTVRLDAARLSVAFGIGYLSHLAVDLYGPLLTGTTTIDTAFLLWPVLVEHPLGVPTPSLPFGKSEFFTVVIVGAACQWLYDRAPVAGDVWRFAAVRLETFRE